MKILWQNKKLLIVSNLFFCHKVFKSCLLQRRQKCVKYVLKAYISSLRGSDDSD